MKKFTSILAVVDRTQADTDLLTKAVALARQSGASLELFLCDADSAYTLARAYDTAGTEQARKHCLADSRHYLDALKDSVRCDGLQVSVDAACESPLYEAIVHKVLRSRPDLVIKSAGGANRRRTLDANDWQLMRTCPVTLMITRGRPWSAHPRFAAAVDMSRYETPQLPESIVGTSACLALGSRAELDVLYSERTEASLDEREAHAIALRKLARGFGAKAGRVHVLSGDAEQTLPAFAANQAYDVLVLGALTHRKGLVAMVGTLTSRLMDTLECDFVLVKPGEYRCPVEYADDQSARDTPPEATGTYARSAPALWQTFFGD